MLWLLQSRRQLSGWWLLASTVLLSFWPLFHDVPCALDGFHNLLSTVFYQIRSVFGCQLPKKLLCFFSWNGSGIFNFRYRHKYLESSWKLYRVCFGFGFFSILHILIFFFFIDFYCSLHYTGLVMCYYYVLIKALYLEEELHENNDGWKERTSLFQR